MGFGSERAGLVGEWRVDGGRDRRVLWKGSPSNILGNECSRFWTAKRVLLSVVTTHPYHHFK